MIKYTKHYTKSKRTPEFVVVHCLTHHHRGRALNSRGQWSLAFKSEEGCIKFIEENDYKVSADFIITATELVEFKPTDTRIDSKDVFFHHCRGFNKKSVGFEVLRDANKTIKDQYQYEQYLILASNMDSLGLPYYFHSDLNPFKTDPDYLDKDLLKSLITNSAVTHLVR
jgi:N-acetyl-anhydromuramyl-L-alanine amidase AmpD